MKTSFRHCPFGCRLIHSSTEMSDHTQDVNDCVRLRDSKPSKDLHTGHGPPDAQGEVLSRTDVPVSNRVVQDGRFDPLVLPGSSTFSDVEENKLSIAAGGEKPVPSLKKTVEQSSKTVHPLRSGMNSSIEQGSICATEPPQDSQGRCSTTDLYSSLPTSSPAAVKLCSLQNGHGSAADYLSNSHSQLFSTLAAVSVSGTAVLGGSENGSVSATANLHGSQHSCGPHRLTAAATAESKEVVTGLSPQTVFPGYSVCGLHQVGTSGYDNRKTKGSMPDTAADTNAELHEQELSEVASRFQGGSSSHETTCTSTNRSALDVSTTSDGKNDAHGCSAVGSDFQGGQLDSRRNTNSSETNTVSNQDDRLTDEQKLPSDCEVFNEDRESAVASASYTWSDKGLFQQNLPPVQESTTSQHQSGEHDCLQPTCSPNPSRAQFGSSDDSLMRHNWPPIQEEGLNAHGVDGEEAENIDEEEEERGAVGGAVAAAAGGGYAAHFGAAAVNPGPVDVDYSNAEPIDLGRERALRRTCRECRIWVCEVTLLPCRHEVVCYFCFRQLCRRYQGVWPCLICHQNFQNIILPQNVYIRVVNRLFARGGRRHRYPPCWKGG